ncbi:MAG: chlorite dismutase family protein [Chloroflexi bacterium]|nr:chlorite dismutase family protein [Chloroflexota bacterium]
MTDVAREYVRWAFYRLRDSAAALDARNREAAFAALQTVLATPVAPWQQCYSLVGLRPDVDFAVWLKTPAGTAPLQEFEHRLRASAIGPHVGLVHNFISMTKPSPYAGRETDPEREALRAYPDGAPYVFVYPMVKTRAWYALMPEERGRIMRGHIAVGQKYPKVRINTTYSYGLDDQEFVVAFEGDDPAEFMDLVSDLRYTESSSYTLRDTPMFTCVLRSPAALAKELAGASARARDGSTAPDAVAPTVDSLRARGERAMRAELQRTLPRTSLSEQDRRHVEEMSAALVAKLLGSPISLLKTPGQGDRYVASARALFALDDDES